jgi:hypothetical protein
MVRLRAPAGEVALNQSVFLPLLKAFNLMELAHHEYDAKVKRLPITREEIAGLQNATSADQGLITFTFETVAACSSATEPVQPAGCRAAGHSHSPG